MIIIENFVEREATPEEVAAMKKQESFDAIEERTRPFTEIEVYGMIVAQQINTLVVDNNTALRMKSFYPEWAVNTAYSVGFKAQHNGKLWQVRQAHTSQNGWEPENTPSLWEQINETNAGTRDDPIPYNSNMALETGKYYSQYGVVYICTRDTGNPVFNDLSTLVGLYVEKA